MRLINFMWSITAWSGLLLIIGVIPAIVLACLANILFCQHVADNLFIFIEIVCAGVGVVAGYCDK